jgi:hypothetical protein
MSVADSEMQNKNYEKAAECYKSIIKNKPGDKNAVMGYASASMLNAGISITDIVVGNASNADDLDLIQSLISDILSNKMTKIDKLLKELTSDGTMLPELFEKSPYPTYVASNFNGSIIYSLTALSIIRPHIPLNIKINLDTLDTLLETLLNVIPKKCINEAKLNLSKATRCLNNISDTSQMMESFKIKLQLIDATLSQKVTSGKWL